MSLFGLSAQERTYCYIEMLCSQKISCGAGELRCTFAGDAFEVQGRGELQMGVLIETMRREGFEMMVGAPTVIFKEIDGARCEPWEMIECTVPDEYTGSVVDMMARRKGELVDMAANPTDSMTAIKYLLPTRLRQSKQPSVN